VYPLPQIGSFAELIKTAVSSGARHCGQGHRQSARNDPFGFSEAMMLRYSLDRPEQAARVGTSAAENRSRAGRGGRKPTKNGRVKKPEFGSRKLSPR
jgi:hypothetical protein